MSRTRIFQWSPYTRTRPGLRGHAIFADEPEVVTYTDYRYFIRLNPWGFRFPGIRYMHHRCRRGKGCGMPRRERKP